VLFAPLPPKPPRAPLAPFGRRLAQAFSAFWKSGFPAAAPAPGALPAPPDGGVTPFFSRHDRNALSEAEPDEDEDDEEDEDGAFVVVVVELEELAAPPHAAATRPIATITTPILRRRRFLEDVARCHVRWSGTRSWVRSRVLMISIVASGSVVLLL
jgi:hypothetical protein